MKKIILSFCFFTNVAFAQLIPNASFEDWTTTNISIPFIINTSYENPNGWTTFNNIFALVTNDLPVKKSMEKKSGTYSLLLQNIEYLNSGKKDTANGIATLEMKVAQKPLLFNGYYKSLVKSRKDSLFISAIATKWNTQTSESDAVGFAFLLVTESSSSFTDFSSPFFYTSQGIVPDSVTILITSGGKKMNQTPGTSFWIDDLNFTYKTTPLALDNENNKTSLSVYPLPATETLHISNLPSTANKARLINSQGIEVATEPISSATNISIEVKNHKKGLYILEIVDQNQSLLSRDKVMIGN